MPLCNQTCLEDVFLCVGLLNECAQVGETHYGDRLVFQHNSLLCDHINSSIGVAALGFSPGGGGGTRLCGCTHARPRKRVKRVLFADNGASRV